MDHLIGSVGLTPLNHPALLPYSVDERQVRKCGADTQPPELAKFPVLSPLVHCRSLPDLAFPLACFVDFQMPPPHKGKKEKGTRNIVKQAQYFTNDHPAAARFSHLFHRLRIPQLVLLLHSPLPPFSVS